MTSQLHQGKNPMTGQQSFSDLFAEYQRRHAAEQAIDDDTWENDLAVTRAAIASTQEAIDAVLEWPASSIAEIAAKLSVLHESYDLGGAGVDRDLIAQLVAEAQVIALVARPSTVFVTLPEGAAA